MTHNLLVVTCVSVVLAVAQSASDYASRARTAIALGKYSEAVKLFEKALKSHPHTAEIESDLGLVYQM